MEDFKPNPNIGKKIESTEDRISIEQALEIMGDSQFIGPDDIENTFGFQPEDVPEISFSEKELIKAKELGQKLILYVSTKGDESAFIMKDIVQSIENKTSDGREFTNELDESRDLSWLVEKDESGNYKEEKLLKTTPRNGWRLTTPNIIRNSYGKNYLEQTEDLIYYLQNDVFREQEISTVYKDAINEFNTLNNLDFKDKVISESESESKEAAKKLSELSINQLTRENLTEIVYRCAVTEKKTGTREIKSDFAWSNSLSRKGYIALAGAFSEVAGLDIGVDKIVGEVGPVGVCFSRSV